MTVERKAVKFDQKEIDQSVGMSTKKIQIDAFMIGNVDAGKTTIAGYLMWHSGSIDPETMMQAESCYEKKTLVHNKYLWAITSYYQRRRKGVSCYDPEFACIFETPMFRIHMHDDTTTSDDFIKTLVAEYGKQRTFPVLVVSASFGEFEAGLSRTGLTRNYILLAFEFNIDPLVILVNKMDQTNPKYSEDRFNEIRNEILHLTKRFENNSRTIVFIPISGSHGDNLMEQSENMPWYNGWTIQRPNSIELSGKIFVDVFNTILPLPSLKDKSLRLVVNDVFTVREHGKVCLGRVESGTLKREMIIRIVPSDVRCQVKTIEQDQEHIEEAVPGDLISFSIGNIAKEDIHRGSIVLDPSSEQPSLTRSFTVQLYILNYPRQITPGFVSTIEYLQNSFSCQLIELMEKIDIRTGKVIEKNPPYLTLGDMALAIFKPMQRIFLEMFLKDPQLGYFRLRHKNDIVAIGRLIYIEKQNN